MSWLAEHLSTLLAERKLPADTVARQLAIERSRMAQIVSGSRAPNENLVKRFAKYFGEDPEEWLANCGEPEQPMPPSVAAPAGFVKVARVVDVPPGEMLIVHESRAVVANVAGDLFAFANVCPHAGGSIGEGFLDGCIVECPWHAGRWDVRTGAAQTMLATTDIATFEVRVAGDEIEINLGQGR
jgi:nitrite reductase/ring-hydroxylating ferredoxin subunit